VSGTISFAPNSASRWAAPSGQKTTPQQLNAKELALVAQLAATDRHVRAHEQAHLSAAGPYAVSGPSYTYATGPNGQQYAVAGDVRLDAGPDPSGPEATVRKAKIIEAAAEAPVDPSDQDRMVAAEAAQMEATAEAQVTAQQHRVRTAYQQGQAVTAAQLIAVII
jgi:hypothetical protein